MQQQYQFCSCGNETPAVLHNNINFVAVQTRDRQFCSNNINFVAVETRDVQDLSSFLKLENSYSSRTQGQYVSRFGLAVRRLADKQGDLSSPFSSKVVVCGPCLMTLSLIIHQTLKWFSSLPILIHESFWCSDSYIIALFPALHTPSPLSLIHI